MLTDKLESRLKLIDRVCSEDEFLRLSPDFRAKLSEVGVDRAETLARGEVVHYFVNTLEELPKLIKDVSEHVRIPPAKRQKFRSVVNAVDRGCPYLDLVGTLTRLFDHASNVNPGPLRKLIDGCESSGDSRLLYELNEYLEGGVTSIPKENLKAYRKILEGVKSPEYERLESGRDLQNVSERLLDHLAFLDFYWQSRVWVDTYLKPLILLRYLQFPVDVRLGCDLVLQKAALRDFQILRNGIKIPQISFQ